MNAKKTKAGFDRLHLSLVKERTYSGFGAS